MHGGEGFFLGLLTAGIIGGLWVIGSGLIEASRSKKRRVLAIVRDGENDRPTG